jgi:hypothetical protein
MQIIYVIASHENHIGKTGYDEGKVKKKQRKATLVTGHEGP